MRKPDKTLKYWDLFCGASLAGTGIEIGIRQLGYTPRGVGINHNKQAIATSQENHPDNLGRSPSGCLRSLFDGQRSAQSLGRIRKPTQ